jgi:HAE1 family hydrophobic/amphiphilic exporter-1
MSVFLPAAFLPGITGQMYKQFALVIAATALISAINAVTLKPTQCAQWLRKPDAQKRKNFFFRGFNAVYARGERAYIGLVQGMVRRSGLVVCIAMILIGVSAWGLTRIPTGFIPVEDQGYIMVSVQLPDAASLERTQRVMESITEIGLKTPGVAHAIAIGGISPLDNNASLANSGIVYLMLDNWEARGKDEDLRAIYAHLSAALKDFEQARTLVLVPPPITGLGLAGGFQMQVELTGGSFDYVELQRVADAIVAEAETQPEIARALTPFRADVPQISLVIDRTQAETLNVSVGEVFNTLQSYLGSSYVNQFVRFGHTFRVFSQADTPFRMQPRDLKRLFARSQTGEMVPISAVVDVQHTQGPALISLYNLYPSATINGAPAGGYSSGQAIETMERIAASQLAPNMRFQWTAMSYQEKLVGNTVYFIFALGILLVYFVLAGQYESYLIPGAVILAVPLALLGTVAVLAATGLANNIYVQIGLVLLIALSAKNAILIVEMAREHRAAGSSILDAAVEAARVRFRPILMTSFTFMLGVLPLVLASGAGAHARKSLGITAFSGMLASTCLAVLFVPSLYVVLQKWSERRTRR